MISHSNWMVVMYSHLLEVSNYRAKQEKLNSVSHIYSPHDMKEFDQSHWNAQLKTMLGKVRGMVAH